MIREINQFNLSSGLLNKYKNLLYYNSHWHQILVENVEDLDRDAVLRSLMRFCYPLDFIPVRYESSKNSVNFLLKNCGPAIEKLCSHNLIVPNPFHADKPFKITVKLCYSHTNDLKINIHINVVSVLNKRFNADTGVLNLENFAQDPELEEYCTLAQPKLCFYIMHLTKNINFKTLKMSNNDIESLKPMEALEGFKNSIIVDLRNNNIKEIEELGNLGHLNITELWLDGNPVCDKFNEINYAKEVRDRLDKLEKLDGANVKMKGVLPFRRNYLCNLNGYDLVDQFLEHYFTLYDAQDRSNLEGLYHKEALFSMNSMYLPGQLTSQTAKLSSYKRFSRNLRQISDFSKTLHGLYRGPSEISKFLKMLPPTEHDPFSFTVDLVMYTEKAAMIVVCGVCRECSDTLLESERMLGFTRTFVLMAGPNGEHSIINEMLHISNATSVQAKRAFKQVKFAKPRNTCIPPVRSPKDKSDMANALKTLTGLKAEWAHKCLEECKYELKAALTLFVDLYKIDKIPKSAFVKCDADGVKNGQQTNEISNPDKGENPSMQFKISPAKNNTIPSAELNRFNPQSPPNIELASTDLTLFSSKQPASNLTAIKIHPIDTPSEREKEPRQTTTQKRSTSRDSIVEKNLEKDKFDLGTRSISPEQLDDFKESNNQDEVVDIISSSEDEDIMSVDLTPASENKNSNFDSAGSSQGEKTKSLEKGKLQESGPRPNESTREWMKRTAKGRKQLVSIEFEENFELFKRTVGNDVNTSSRNYALDMLVQHARLGSREYELVINFFYEVNLSEARLLTAALLSQKRFKRYNDAIKLFAAQMECIHGDVDIGKMKLKKLIEERPNSWRIVIDYVVVLLNEKNFAEAREFLKPYADVKHHLHKRIVNHARYLETNVYKTKLHLFPSLSD